MKPVITCALLICSACQTIAIRTVYAEGQCTRACTAWSSAEGQIQGYRSKCRFTRILSERGRFDKKKLTYQVLWCLFFPYRIEKSSSLAPLA
jgi:hypothetical protein